VGSCTSSVLSYPLISRGLISTATRAPQRGTKMSVTICLCKDLVDSFLNSLFQRGTLKDELQTELDLSRRAERVDPGSHPHAS
jgi:hypothetical protein